MVFTELGDYTQSTGRGYVVFGGDNAFSSSTFALSSLNGSNGFAFYSNSRLFYSVASGDINGDGLGDIIIGEADDGTVNPNEVVIISGSSNTPSSINVDHITSANGFIIIHGTSNTSFGFSVAEVGDVSGDGYNDVLVGAPGANSFGGAAYLIYGSALNSSGGSFNVSSLSGSNGYVFKGPANSATGVTVSAAGDVNGDGYTDFLIAAPDSTNPYNGVTDAGTVFFVYGGPSNLAALHAASETASGNTLAAGVIQLFIGFIKPHLQRRRPIRHRILRHYN